MYLLCYEEKRTDKVMTGRKGVTDEERNTDRPVYPTHASQPCFSVYLLDYLHVYPAPLFTAPVSHHHLCIQLMLHNPVSVSTFLVTFTSTPPLPLQLQSATTISPFLPPHLQLACRWSKFKVTVTVALCVAGDEALCLNYT